MAPLILTDKLGLVDVEANVVEGPGGLTATPRAIRHGLSLGLAALYPEFKQRLRFGNFKFLVILYNYCLFMYFQPDT